MECTESKCDNQARARGLCWKHYRRVLRHGDPTQAMTPREAALKRWRKADDERNRDGLAYETEKGKEI